MSNAMDELFRQMLRIRRVEEALAERYAEQEMRCPMHLCIGQEAAAVGVVSALAEDDRVFSGHRAHGHYLAKGGDLTAMIAELYGRASGCSKGRGGSMHLIDTDAGFMGSTAIVGGT
ncbi:MAG TPA: thiamine pyrophosphate-dependent dehydrogenase E1 component subunit alpha, partial [Chromatiales bacterium]|nr:thiamine pyrophosphate-dependent dehydrogenase E1 component subunit alpha [Chromatiales bacterium]HEX22273.1 thiamine pyrophosphate-dependent dehydrogenase E1 component subunit alpha [Chromatiales bacterium]